MTYRSLYIAILALYLCSCIPTTKPTPSVSPAPVPPVPHGWMAMMIGDNSRLEASGVQWLYNKNAEEQ